MSLKLLCVEDEPELEIVHVARTDEVENLEIEPELPGEFLVEDDVNVLADAASALESIGYHIACEGMDLSTARELEKIVPGFIRKSGGNRAFTSQPSLEGLADAAKTVKDKFTEVIKRLRDFVVQMYQRFIAWIKSKTSDTEGGKQNETFAEEINEFLAARRNRDAMEYISSLPDTAAEAAEEVARFMDGETGEFASRFTDQIERVMKRVAIVEKMMMDNPTQFRLARGAITVADLFKVEADAAINGILKKAMTVANNGMSARNAEQFAQAMQAIAEVSAELNEFEKGMVVNDAPSSEYGDDKAMPFVKVYDNVKQAVTDMERVDIHTAANAILATAGAIVDVSQSVKIEEILEMIPGDVDANKHSAYGQQIASLYRRIAKVGADVLRLWRMRFYSVAAINKVMLAMIEVVDAFENGVVDAGAGLQPEQKTQLAKALANKGLKIVF